MTPRKLHQQALYLEPEKAQQLDDLARRTRIPKAVLLREAVDDLLLKHGVVATGGIGKANFNVVWSDEKRLNEIARQAGCKDYAELQERVNFERSVAKTKAAKQRKQKSK